MKNWKIIGPLGVVVAAALIWLYIRPAGMVAGGQNLANSAGQYWSRIPLLAWVAFWSAVVIAVILGVTWLDTKVRPTLTRDPGGRMQLWKAIVLLLFLIVASAVSVYAVYGLWQEPAPSAEAPKEPDCSKVPPDAPVVQYIDPSKVFLGSGRSSIRVLGCNFPNGASVTFDGVERSAGFVNDKALSVPLATSDFGAPGTVMIAVSYLVPAPAGQPAPGGANQPAAPTKKSTNQQPLYIQSPAQQMSDWSFLGATRQINQELRLLLLVLFAGCLGSSVFALKSVGDYIGEKKLSESWFTFYLVQPLEGAGVAFIFYVVLRGGLWAGTNVNVKASNQFGIIAVAALIGVFSDTAFLKLKEVFETLFKPADTRSGKIAGALKIATSSPLPDATAGAPYKKALQAADGSPPYTWATDTIPKLPTGLALNAAGELSGTPPGATPKTKYTFEVTDSAGVSVNAKLDLTVNPPPSISMASPLADGTAGNNYNTVQLTAVDGTPPYKWSTTTTPALPAGLRVDADGKVSGNPTGQAPQASYKFTLTDANGATAAKDLQLTIQP